MATRDATRRELGHGYVIRDVSRREFEAAKARQYLQRNTRRLEKQQRRQAGTVQSDAYQFKLSPTCPPSTSIRFNGGLAWWPAYSYWPAGFFIPSYTVDLTDPDKVSVRRDYSGYTYTFNNPYWYAPCIAIITGYATWPPPDPWPEEPPDTIFYLYGTHGGSSPYFAEYETAGEAEMALQEIIGEQAAYYGIAAGGLVLRNNGNVGAHNQYMPVDPINRGRSYLFGGKRYGWELG